MSYGWVCKSYLLGSDTVNFGTVTLSPTLTTLTIPGPGGGTDDLVLYGQDTVSFNGSPITAVDIVNNVLVQCNVAVAGCTQSATTASQTLTTLALIFTVPAGDTSIQVAWSGPFTYMAPTPLPATLPLFAGGIAFMSFICRWRRRSRAAAFAAQSRVTRAGLV
jgi:hypothetical protein